MSSNVELIFTYHSPPPREQSKYERWSLVFFTRPGNTHELRAMTDESPMIADAVAKAQNPDMYHTGASAGDWFTRRIKNQRLKNRTVRSRMDFPHVKTDGLLS